MAILEEIVTHGVWGMRGKKKKKLMNEYCVHIGEKRIPYPLQWAS